MRIGLGADSGAAVDMGLERGPPGAVGGWFETARVDSVETGRGRGGSAIRDVGFLAGTGVPPRIPDRFLELDPLAVPAPILWARFGARSGELSGSSPGRLPSGPACQSAGRFRGSSPGPGERPGGKDAGSLAGA